MSRKNYSGSDLPNEWKVWVRKEMKRIEKVLIEKGCTDIQKSYNFYDFTILFTSPSGQTYHLFSSDTRGLGMYDGYKNIVYRTTKNYNDWTGGSNNHIQKDRLEDIRLL